MHDSSERVRLLATAAALAIVAAAAAYWWSGRAERHLVLARTAADEGEQDVALAWLAVPEAHESTRQRALLLRARLAVERGDLKAAVATLDQMKPEAGDAAGFAYWKGRTLFAAKQPLLAMNWLKEALEHKPDDAEAARWLAAAAYDVGDRTTAVSALESAARSDPDDPRVWRTLGLIYKENVEYEDASEAFRRSLKLDPAQPPVRLELAEVLIPIGKAAEAGQLLESCRGRVPEGRRAALAAESLRLRGDLDALRTTVQSGLAAAPDDPGLLTQQARLDLQDDHAQTALERIDRALRADPYRSETHYLRGLVLRKLGREVEARQGLDRASELNRGIAEMSALNDQAARNPNDAEVRVKLGQVCVSLGKQELARSWYRAALACDPNHAGAQAGLDSLRSAPQATTGRAGLP